MNEEWRAVARNPKYEVSSLGRVRRVVPYRSTKVGRLRKTYLNKDGYPTLGLPLGGRIRSHTVHVLVCEAFHGPKPSPIHQAAHGDGVRANCRADNLRWALPVENYADRTRHGTAPVGARNPMAKLTPVNVWAIRARYLLGETAASLGRCFGVSDTHVLRIVSRDVWASEPPLDPTPFLTPGYLSDLERIA